MNPFVETLPLRKRFLLPCRDGQMRDASTEILDYYRSVSACENLTRDVHPGKSIPGYAAREGQR